MNRKYNNITASLVIGLSVGVPLAIIIIVLLCLYRRERKFRTERRGRSQRLSNLQSLRQEEDRYEAPKKFNSTNSNQQFPGGRRPSAPLTQLPQPPYTINQGYSQDSAPNSPPLPPAPPPLPSSSSERFHNSTQLLPPESGHIREPSYMAPDIREHTIPGPLFSLNSETILEWRDSLDATGELGVRGTVYDVDNYAVPKNDDDSDDNDGGDNNDSNYAVPKDCDESETSDAADDWRSEDGDLPSRDDIQLPTRISNS